MKYEKNIHDTCQEGAVILTLDAALSLYKYLSIARVISEPSFWYLSGMCLDNARVVSLSWKQVVDACDVPLFCQTTASGHKQSYSLFHFHIFY